jgi:ubiquinone/menaquinone biosynthesis C-methylase UbiE
MSLFPFKRSGDYSLSNPQRPNQDWWERNPMTYDWGGTLPFIRGTREWFEEIDHRFLTSAYYALGKDPLPFGRFLKADLVSGKDVLEIGCGMGSHAGWLAQSGARLTAIDITAGAVAMTKRRFEVFGLTGRIEQADCEDLPFSDETFDAVWSWGVIHHSSSTERCLAEITRVLKPGGRILLMVYYRPSIVYYLHCGLLRGILLGQLASRALQEIYTAASDGFYARVFTKKELRALLETHYSQIKLSVVGLKAELLPIPACRLKERIVGRIPDWLASAILGLCGSMIVIGAQKNISPK